MAAMPRDRENLNSRGDEASKEGRVAGKPGVMCSPPPLFTFAARERQIPDASSIFQETAGAPEITARPIDAWLCEFTQVASAGAPVLTSAI